MGKPACPQLFPAIKTACAGKMKTVLLIHQQKGAFAQDGGSVADVGSRELHVSDNANIALSVVISPQNWDSLQTVFAKCAKGAFAVPYFLIPHTNI